ncbi:hypothetical protein WOLCODRAFT_143722 [Wolfiporia cocos MD-104 SS10]|uniref:Pentatricopeptide repeat-containing protein n=1 Tax=Wolfiporia cocos (strain MD-104) TaxID=742152 RepID=A0A2H3JJJ6_WOLCO|nr:hypothetical protein WOLCODRAFT_143722 [Wolfiporia cocos MD-104 SS10]
MGRRCGLELGGTGDDALDERAGGGGGGLLTPVGFVFKSEEEDAGRRGPGAAVAVSAAASCSNLERRLLTAGAGADSMSEDADESIADSSRVTSEANLANILSRRAVINPYRIHGAQQPFTRLPRLLACCSGASLILPSASRNRSLAPSRAYSDEARKSRSGSSPQEASLTKDASFRQFNTHLHESLKRTLKAGNESLAVKNFHEELDEAGVDNPSRFQAYESAIDLFLRHGFPMGAAMLHGRMRHSGFIPSVSIRARLSLIGFLQHSPSEQEVMDVFRKFFAHEQFDEQSLQDVFNVMEGNTNSPPEFFDKVTELFIQSRGTGYRLSDATINMLVHLHIRTGSVASAQRWVTRNWDGPSTQEPPSTPRTYTTLLREVAASAPADTAAVYKWIYSEMNARGIRPDLPFYNALVAAEVARKRYAQAFQIFHLLRSFRVREMTPDAYTFVSLFRALRHIDRPRSAKTRKARRPDNAPTTRVFFCEMFSCHLTYTGGQPRNKSPVFTADALHKALAVFMLQGDYCAAFIVLRILHLLELPVDHCTYRTVISALTARIGRELVYLPKSSEPHWYWSYRFLGMATYPVGKSVDVDKSLLESILRIGMEKRLSLEYIPPRHDESAQANPAHNEGLKGSLDGSSDVSRPAPATNEYTIPSMEQLVGDEEPPPFMAFDIVPLGRILRRAILAECTRIEQSFAKEVSLEIAEAKREMLAAAGVDWDVGAEDEDLEIEG